ncbi:MAG TPA: hypothetical protein VHV74_08885, partial [Pseudonocardiaceae bacterium]|nr:hypothetical protein [Pseudonocardiaceae bacterium]
NVVSVYTGTNANGTLIGAAQVDPLDGTFDVRVRGSAVPAAGTVFLQTSRGGQAVAVVSLTN